MRLHHVDGSVGIIVQTERAGTLYHVQVVDLSICVEARIIHMILALERVRLYWLIEEHVGVRRRNLDACTNVRYRRLYSVTRYLHFGIGSLMLYHALSGTARTQIIFVAARVR